MSKLAQQKPATSNKSLDELPLSPLKEDGGRQLSTTFAKGLARVSTQDISLSSQTDAGLSNSAVATSATSLNLKPLVSYMSTAPTKLVDITGTSTCEEGVEEVDIMAQYKGNTAVKEMETSSADGALKWVVLVLTCLLLFGSDYCYDLPGAFGAGEGVTVQTYFTQRGVVYNQKMNQALYAIYSYPNMVMTIVGGLLIDKYIGLRKTTMLFCGIVVAASLTFAMGVATTSYSLMVLSRFLFGCSGENLFVAQGSFVSRWFGGSKYMAFAFGIAVSFSRLGGALVYLLSPAVAEVYGAPASAFTGFGVAFVSFCSALVLIWLDHRSEKSGRVRPQNGSTEAELEDAESGSPTSTDEPQHPFLLAYFPTLPKTLWLLAAGCCLCYGATFPFIAIAKTYFERVYGMDAATASKDTGLFHLLGALLCPLIGLVVDRIGKGPVWLGLSAVGLASLFSFLLAFPGVLSAVLVMTILSFMYAIFIAGSWSFVNYTTPSSAGGFALGIMIAATNFGLATNPLIVGTILDANTGGIEEVQIKSKHHKGVEVSTAINNNLLPTEQGFEHVLAFLIFTAGLALVTVVALWKVDKRNKGILMASPDERVILKAKMDEELLAKWRIIDVEALDRS